MAAVTVSPGFPARARAGQFWASAEGLTSPMDSPVVLRLRSVFPFTTRRFPRAATPVLLLPLKRRPLRPRSPHPPRRQNDFTSGLFVRLTDHRTREGFTGHSSGPFFTRRRHATPPWSLAANRICGQGRTSGVPSASSRGGDWRTTQAESAVSRCLSAWPRRDVSFSGPPGGDALATYLRPSWRSSSREF
jgi:hypothetical protein